MSDTPSSKPLMERLRARSKAWADLHEIASHIGVFPLDACMIDSRLETEAADALDAIIEKCANVCESRAGSQATAAFRILMSAADAIRSLKNAVGSGSPEELTCELPECKHRLCVCGHAECGHADDNVQPNCSDCLCASFRLADVPPTR